MSYEATTIGTIPTRAEYVHRWSTKEKASRRVSNLTGPHGMEANLRVSFQFQITNNFAEYDALVTSLNMAIKSVLPTYSGTSYRKIWL